MRVEGVRETRKKADALLSFSASRTFHILMEKSGKWS